MKEPRLDFTSGPWEVRAANNGHTSIYPVGSPYRIADVYIDPQTHNGTLAGNARIMAGSLTMYNALMNIIGYAYCEGNIGDRMANMSQLAQQAIAKVEGRS